MTISISRKDILWNYAGNILNIGMGILVLPLILSLLPPQEIGLWYVFSSISSLVMLVDFGFSPTIMRSVTYSWSGAKELLPQGIAHVEIGGEPNYSLLHSIIFASKRIYLILASIYGVLSLTFGTWYVYGLLHTNKSTSLVAWSIYAIGMIVNLYYEYWTPVLQGIGAIKEANKALVLSRVVYVVFSTLGLLLGWGLIWLSIMYLISGFLLRILSKYYFSILFITPVSGEPQEDYTVKKILITMWPNARNLGAVTVGAWLITKATPLLCANYLGLRVTAQYGLGLQLFGIVGMISALLFNSYTPEIASARANKLNDRYLRLFSRAITVQWVVGLAGVASVIYIAPLVLHFIGAHITLLPGNLLWVLGLILFLESNHSTFATLITLENQIPFVRAAIYSGVGIILLSLVLLKFTDLGILGVVISQGLVQIAYNNWRWPMWVLHDTNSSILKILKLALIDVKSLLKGEPV